MRKGKLIVIEGPDCSGKDTIIEAISNYETELEYYISREPGGTYIGEKIREILLDKSHAKMDDTTTFMLFNAARKQHVIEKVDPLLSEGMNVILNRYYYSSIIYQGIMSNNGKGLPNSFVSNMITEAIKNKDGSLIIPDLTVVLYSSDFNIINDRIKSKYDKDRLELNDTEYFGRVNKEYQYIYHNKAVHEIEYYKRPQYLFIDISKYVNNIDKMTEIIMGKISRVIWGLPNGLFEEE